MLRKHLHWGLLAISVALWLLAATGVGREARGRKPEHIAAAIEAGLRRQLAEAEGIDRYAADVVRWIGNAGSGEVRKRIADQPFYLFAYRGDSLIAWSTAAALPSPYMQDTGALYYINNSVYYGYRMHRSWLPLGVELGLLFPIAHSYPFHNEYLQPRFTVSSAIDPNTIIADTPAAGTAPLHSPDGSIMGWVHPPQTAEMPGPPPSWVVWCWLASLVAFATWVNGRAAKLAAKKGAGIAIILIAGVALSGRVALLLLRPPLHISESEIFSPRLFAASTVLPSLGDLLLHALTLLWILLFIVPRLRYAVSFRPTLARWLAGIFLGAALFSSAVLFIRLIRSLVLDSLIPFDAQHLSSLDGSSVAGLLVASLLLAILLLIAGIVRNTLRAQLPSFWRQSLALLLGALLPGFLFRNDMLLPVYGIGALWLTINILGQYVTRLREGAGPFRVGNLFWSIAHCMLLTLLLQHYNRARESQVRRHFAEHIATRHDDAMEYNFGQSLTLIRTDTALHAFLRSPTEVGRLELETRLTSLYFNHVLAAYQPKVYLFDAAERPLLNEDTTALNVLRQISETSIPSRTASDLYYREAAINDHIYLALMAIEDSLGSVLGHMAIDLEQKRIVSETVLPELLQPATINQAEKAAGYSYAIYAGGRLVAQTSDYPFPFYVAYDPARPVYFERYGNDFSTLIYTPNAYRTVHVWRRFGTLSQVLTIFSYLLLLRFLLLGMAAAYRQLSHWIYAPKDAIRYLRGIGIRRRLQLSIMGIVALSFVAIGIATIVFLRQQYDNSGKSRRQAIMQTVTRSIQQWLKERGSDLNVEAWQYAMATPEFRYFLADLAAAQKIDINIFDQAGWLTNTTQPAIYDEGLLAPVMRYTVLQDFITLNRSLISEVESIGTLRYQSAYTPLRVEGGQIAAYVNVPLFYAQRELDEQISNVVVTLVNLYAAVLLLSALLAYFISRWVTRAFDLIIHQFGRLNLHRNELLQWPYDDEVGVLVAEYNKMVRKVEESVALLARNEREGAFREMARQVAHEIKNPLTPMSLYVQRLQRAIQAGEPDVIDLARRVSDALLEQINNLSVIATEFGAFARIGTARPEEIELTELVRNVVEPFAADGTTTVTWEVPEEPVKVMAGRSQLVRIITNLMKNATQAIPEDRQGAIHVRLIKEGSAAVLRVSDNGTGITPETQEKLFTPYFTTKSSGTGLGLAMSRQMVEAWGGTIHFETVQGEGSSFIIHLPTVDHSG